MKIRIKENSIRFRLTQGEVSEFEETGRVSATTEFPNHVKFEYELQRVSGNAFKAEFASNKISLSVPEEAAKGWASPEEVGMEAYLQISNGKELKLLIEKDFACLTVRKDEDESDNFPNPYVNC